MTIPACEHDAAGVCWLCSDQVSWWREARVRKGYGVRVAGAYASGPGAEPPNPRRVPAWRLAPDVDFDHEATREPGVPARDASGSPLPSSTSPAPSPLEEPEREPEAEMAPPRPVEAVALASDLPAPASPDTEPELRHRRRRAIVNYCFDHPGVSYAEAEAIIDRLAGALA